MRRFTVMCVAALIAFSAGGCGGNKEAEQAKAAAEEAKKAAQSGAAGSLQDMAKGMEQFAQGMQQMQTDPDGKAYEPVSFRDLQALLPEVSGWERGELTGEMMSAPVKFSQAETAYSKGDAQIDVKIVDTAMARILMMPYQMFLIGNYARESSDGYEKATRIAGNPGWEKWNSQDKSAEFGVIVGQRFLVTAEGRNVDDAKAVQSVLDKIDLRKLSGLK